jgi:hypothetical protein
MDRQLGKILGTILLRHKVASVPAEEIIGEIDQLHAWPADVAGLLPIKLLLWMLIREDLITTREMDWDDHGHDLITSEEILAQVSAATHGEWAPTDLTSTYDADADAEVVAFTFEGTQFRWEIPCGSGEAVTDLLSAFDDFAAEHDLTGRVFRFDIGMSWYLPARLVEELTAFIEETRRAWPPADELVAIFRTVVPPPPDPGPSWAGRWQSVWSEAIDCLLDESSLEQINHLADSGERPLHALVLQTRQVGHAMLRRERCDVIEDLIGRYRADPHLRDASGSTAFDYADGDEDLIKALAVVPGSDEAG